jgi:mRNA interferase MazF
MDDYAVMLAQEEASMTEQLKRGEVWLANLNPAQGSEQAGIRPIIIFKMILFLNFPQQLLLFP